MIPPTVMPPVTPKTEKKKHQPTEHTNCGYYGSNDISPDAVQYRGNLAETGKVWSIQSVLSLFSLIRESGPRQHQCLVQSQLGIWTEFFLKKPFVEAFFIYIPSQLSTREREVQTCFISKYTTCQCVSSSPLCISFFILRYLTKTWNIFLL